MYGNSPETYQIVLKISRVSRKSHSFWKLSRMSGNIPEDLEIFQSVYKFCRVSWNFLEICKCAQIYSMLSRNFQWCQEVFNGDKKKILSVQKLFENCNYLSVFHISIQQLSGLRKLSIKKCLNDWEFFFTLPPSSHSLGNHSFPSGDCWQSQRFGTDKGERWWTLVWEFGKHGFLS